MESPVGMPAPTMEMLGFKNISNNFRADSEELFKIRLTTGENQGGLVHNRSRQLSRIIAEAKGRTQTPTTSSDMQSILKRYENLEKAVRSLKLNLAFMNRKDSEQTKQIEELQKQHER